MKKYKLSDSQLVLAYKNGNEEAFRQLLTRHKARVFSTIYVIVKDSDLTQDLLQETLIKAVNTIQAGRYNEEGKFLPWVLRIAHNMAIDHFRKQKRYPMVNVEDNNPVFNTVEFSESSIEDQQIRQDTYDLLHKLIGELPDAQRDVLMRRHFQKMSFQEIADATGVSINTALGRMRYALINLRKKMDSHHIAYDQNLYSQ